MVMGGEHTAEYRVLTVDRREIWLRETIFIEHDLLGRLNRVTGVGFDITARKKEAEELARTRGEFAFLLAIASASQSSLDEVDAGALLKTELKQHLGIVTGRLYIDQQFNGELKCIDSWGAESAHTELWDSHIGERYGALTAAQLAADKQFGVTEIGSRIAPDGSEDGAGRQAIAIPLLDNKQLWGVLVVMCPTQWVMNGDCIEAFAFLGREIGVHLRKSFVALPPFEEGTP